MSNEMPMEIPNEIHGISIRVVIGTPRMDFTLRLRLRWR